ncbi:MAG: T9SS type A sorting domain-containing protein [Bacteroidales bacterium]|nr:T9SS type A sorting domain-containing protein [Bacteroidales bacterium]
MKNALRFLTVMGLVIWACSSQAQTNLLQGHNCDFQESNANWLDDTAISTDYTYDPSYHGLQNGGVENGSGKFSITAQANNGNQNYFNCIGHPSGHSAEKFLAVNGFGGNRDYYHLLNNTPSNKKILRYTIQVQPNMLYDFSFWATHLTNGDNTGLPFDPFDGRVKFRVKCNSANVYYGNNELTWEPEHVANAPKWCKSPTYRCLSNSNGQLVITLYDDNIWTSEYGDDFGIDDAELKLASGYSVTAQDFSVSGCNENYPLINLNDHVTITQPEGQPTLSTIFSIRGNANQSWTTTSNTAVNTNHGSAYFDSNKRIHYTPDEGYVGDDQILYRVQKYGMSSEKTITLHVQGVPSNFVVSNFPEGYWCKGDPLNISCTFDSNGSSATSQRWEWAFSPTDNWNELNLAEFVEIASYFDYYVRYKAVNGCGAGYSEPMLLRVCSGPILNTSQISAPSTICEGGSLPDAYLTQVWVPDPQGWNNDVGTSGWEVKHGNGPWQPLAEVTLAQGDKLRFRAENCCDEVMTNEVTVSVTAGPEFTQPTPSFLDHYCVDDVLNLSSMATPSYQTNGITINDQYWVRSTDGGVTYDEIDGNPYLDMSWDGNWICYRLECDCGSVNSGNPFVIHVYEEPVFTEDLEPFEGPFCPGETLSLSEAPDFYSYEGTEHGWAISTSSDPNGNYIPLELPIALSVDHNGKWLRHWANGCGLSYSNAVQIQVNTQPTLTSLVIDDPDVICSGVALVLPEVGVADWNGEANGEGWEIYHNGAWEPYEPGATLSIDYNGALLHFWAASECGRTETNPAIITVIRGPEFTNPQQLDFSPFYCDGIQLIMPQDPVYVTNGSQVEGYWAYSEDNVDYLPITGAIELTEEWNGRYISFLLQSNCGDIRYPYPFQLSVYGIPLVDSIAELEGPFCPGEVLPLPVEPEFSNTFDGSEHGWSISDDDDQYGHYQSLNGSLVLHQEDDGRWLRYDVFGCSTGYSNAVQIHVGDKPSLTQVELNEPDPICEGSPLDSYYLNSVYVEEWNQFYSEENYSRWEVYYHGAWVELPEYFTIDYDGCPIRYVAHNDCGDTYTTEATLQMIAAPEVEYDIVESICQGQLIGYQYVGSNNVPVEYWLWKFEDELGNVTEFDPDSYQFNVPGVYNVYYVVVNQCNADNPVYSGPNRLTVTPGPEFQQETSWPESLEICDGQTLGVVLDEAGVSVPELVDPSISHTLLGWFVKYKDENNNTHYDPCTLGQSITESFHGSELCYAMTGDCSSVPIYSGGILLQVLGRPEIVSLSMSQSFCSGELFPYGVELEIDNHNSSCTEQWQWKMAGQSWMDIPNLPLTLANEHDGIQVRMKISSTQCGFEAVSDPMVLWVAGTPEIIEDTDDMVGQIGVCGDGALVVTAPEVDWHHTTPEEGEWQVGPTANGSFGTGPFGSEGLMFDVGHVAPAFDGWYVRYHVEGCGAEDNSTPIQLSVYESSDVHIDGSSEVLVMSSFWPGVYYYYTDVVGVNLNWTLEMLSPIQDTMSQQIPWQIQDTIIDGKNCCQLTVTSSGRARLTAAVGDGSCGNDVILINASYFGVDEQESVNVQLYPNPTDGLLFVKGEELMGVVIYNLMGQQVKAISCPMGDLVEADVHDLAPALYVVQVQTKKGNKTLLFSVL